MCLGFRKGIVYEFITSADREIRTAVVRTTLLAKKLKGSKLPKVRHVKAINYPTPLEIDVKDNLQMNSESLDPLVESEIMRIVTLNENNNIQNVGTLMVDPVHLESIDPVSSVGIETGPLDIQVGEISGMSQVKYYSKESKQLEQWLTMR